MACSACQTLREALKKPVKFVRLFVRDSWWRTRARIMRMRRRLMQRITP